MLLHASARYPEGCVGKAQQAETRGTHSTSAAVLGSSTGMVTHCWEKAVTGTSVTSSLCNLLVPVPCLGYVTYSVLGLHKQLLHNTGTLDKDFIHVIKQRISNNLEIALGWCFPCLPLSLNSASNSAQMEDGVFSLFFFSAFNVNRTIYKP